MQRLTLLIAAAALLSACSGVGANPTPLPTVVLDGGVSPATTPGAPSSGVVASGIVASPFEAQLAFGQGGIVEAVHVAIGDTVEAGETLVELESTAAQLELARAERAVREMTSAGAISAADQALALARQEQDTAQKKVNSLNYPRASEDFIDSLRAQITLARDHLEGASDEFNDVADQPSNDPGRARAQVRLTAAQEELNRLIGQYNWYTGHPSEIDVDLIRANFDAANATVHEAEWYAAALRGEPIPAEASGAKLTVLQEAKDAVIAARAALEATRIVSPVDGTVGKVDIHPGEYAAPGQVVAVIADLDHLQVETTDLSELDLPEVEVGQPVTVDIDALGIQAAGHVVAISPVAETLGGDVVYAVVVALDEIPEGLRPGMSAEVSFGAPR